MDLRAYQYRLAFTLPSSKQRTPDLLEGSGLRTTATRQRKSTEHIGLDFTTLIKCVNAFETINFVKETE